MQIIPITYTLYTQDNLQDTYNKVTSYATNTEVIAEEFINNTFSSRTGILNICTNIETHTWGSVKYSYITFSNSESSIVLTSDTSSKDKGSFKVSILYNNKEDYSITLNKPVDTILIKHIINSLIEYLYKERLIA